MFKKKLNATDVAMNVKEKIIISEGQYEGALAHDNVVRDSIIVLDDNGIPVRDVVLADNPEKKWETIIRIRTGSPYVVLEYDTFGDVVDADDINEITAKIIKHQSSITDALEGSNKNKEDIASIEESISDIKDSLKDITNKVEIRFHDVPQNAVKESMIPSEFEYGTTLCSQSVVSDFPTINEYGVSVTFRGQHSNYAQIFITRFGDIWSRRSGVINEWNGEWYNAKGKLESKAEQEYVDTKLNLKANKDSVIKILTQEEEPKEIKVGDQWHKIVYTN